MEKEARVGRSRGRSVGELYNQARPHLALQKDSPFGRAVRRIDSVVAVPVLGGLHHQYIRI